MSMSVKGLFDEEAELTFWGRVFDGVKVLRFRIGAAIESTLRFFERLTHGGIAGSDLWSVDYTIARWALPRLKAFMKQDRAGYPHYFSEWNKNECSREEYDEMVRSGERDPEVAAGLKRPEEKWNDVLGEIVFALDWKVRGDFGSPVQKESFYREYGYKDPSARLESNASYSYYYEMTPEYVA